MSAPKRTNPAPFDEVCRRMMQLAIIGSAEDGLRALATVSARLLASQQARGQHVDRLCDRTRLHAKVEDASLGASAARLAPSPPAPGSMIIPAALASSRFMTRMAINGLSPREQLTILAVAAAEVLVRSYPEIGGGGRRGMCEAFAEHLEAALLVVAP